MVDFAVEEPVLLPVLTLGLVSDLHWESETDFELDASGVDVLIAAGDLLNGTQPETAIARLSKAAGKTPVLYVPGNHEFYGQTIASGLERLRAAAKNTKVRILYRQAVTIGGVEFLGATLWSGFDLFGPLQRPKCQKAAQESQPDFQRIFGTGRKPITPAQVRAEHLKDVEWLGKHLKKNERPPTVVVSHFAPSPLSSKKGRGNDPLTAYYCNANDDLVVKANAWLHGHVHQNRHYRLAQAEENHGLVLSNPRGFVWHQQLQELAPETQVMLRETYPGLGDDDWLEVPENTQFCNPLRFTFDPNTGAVEVLPETPPSRDA